MNFYSNSRILCQSGEFTLSTFDFSFIDEYKKEEIVSLQRSVAQVSFYVKSLDKYVRIAELNCNKSGKYGLTNDESAAIYLYTIQWDEGTDESFYFLLNRTLRLGNDRQMKLWFPYLKLFSTGINKLPSIRTQLWRNIHANLCKHFSKNQLVRWTNIISCSSNLNQIFDTFWNFNGQNTLFQINANHAKNIRDYSRFQHEDEFIILPSTTFSVTDFYISKNKFNNNCVFIIHLSQI